MTDIGITSIGVHVPAARLESRIIAEAHAWAFPALTSEAKGEKAFCNWDEDVITMAVEAARECVAADKRDEVSGLVLASTTAPFADLGNAAIVSTAIALGQTFRLVMRAGPFAPAPARSSMRYARHGRTSLSSRAMYPALLQLASTNSVPVAPPWRSKQALARSLRDTSPACPEPVRSWIISDGPAAIMTIVGKSVGFATWASRKSLRARSATRLNRRE